MSESRTDWQRLQNILILLIACSFCLYLPTLFYNVFADDEIYLAYTNRFLRESPWTNLYQLFLKPANPWEFLPLRDFTYWLDFRIYGDEPGGFHATNLAWYAACCLSCFRLFRELIRFFRPEWTARAGVLSLFGVVLFAVHPAHVEAVAWIASRKDLVAATLGFLALSLAVETMRRGWRTRGMIAATAVLFVACFGKASAMTGVLVLSALILAFWRDAPEVSRGRKYLFLLLAWASVAVAFAIHLQVGASSGIRIENHPGFWPMLERASRILSAELGILLFPYPLRLYHDVYQLGAWHWLVSATAIVVLALALWTLTRKRSLSAFGVILALVPLVIYLQLIPFTTWSLASERFVFVPVAGVALILVNLCARLRDPNRLIALALIIVVPCVASVWLRVAEWGDNVTLVNREYELQPGFHNAIRDHIGFSLLPDQRYDEAAALARTVPRAYASEALLALVDTDRAFQALRETNSRGMKRNADPQLQRDFCSAVARLAAAVRNGYTYTPDEADISYNNILRTLGHALKYRFGESTVICSIAAPLPHD